MCSRALLIAGLWVAVSTAALVAAEPQPAPPATRTLEAITIEGAVDVPQVLFITSRDNARFDDGLAWSFLQSGDNQATADTLPILVRPYPFPFDITVGEPTLPASPALPEAKE